MDSTIDAYVFTRKDGHRVSITSENTASTTVHAGLLMVPEGLFEELLRLAQREADLLEKIDHMDAQMVGASEDHQRDLAAAKCANEILGGKVNRLEEELRSLNATALVRRAEGLEAGVRSALADAERAQSRADAFQRALKAAEARIAALERENREKCLELAEKAEEIRNLQDQVARLSAASLLAAANVNQAEAERDAHQEESAHRLAAFRLADHEAATRRKRVIALEAAIEDGIAHVEQARQLLDRFGADWHAKTMDELDLAHEALSGAVRVDRGGAAPRVEAAPAEPKGREVDIRLRSIEARQHFFSERADAIERVLAGHADRLIHLEQDRRVDGESNLTWHPYFRNGIAALEKIVSRITADLEGLKARTSALEAGKE